MTKQNKSGKDAAVSTTTEVVREETGLSPNALTPREEKVLRMVHGMTEDDAHALQFGLGADEETQLKLAMIEQQVMQFIAAGAEEGSKAGRITPAELLASWLEEE